MPRALLSVSDKTGLVEFARGLARSRLRARVHRRHRARPAAGGLAGHRHLRRHRVSRDDGRPRQDAAPARPRGHPGPPRPGRRPRVRREQHGITLIDLVVVNLYPFVQGRRESGHAVRRADRGDRHRRSEPGARGRQELPRRARRRLARRLRGGARAARSRRRADAGVPFRAGAQGVRAHRRRYDTRHRVDARDRSRMDADGFVRAAPAAACPASLSLELRKVRDLRYGENPHQRAALVREDPAAGLGCDGAAGQGAVVHEPARSRRRRAHRRSSSASRRPWSSSTRTRAAPRRAAAPPTPTSARATPMRWRRSAASSV